MIYNFKTENTPNLSQVGGKAKALIETTEAGFPVPEGIALSVKFFQPWLKEIKSSKEWKDMLKNTNKETCHRLVKKASNMRFHEEQGRVFEIELKGLSGDLLAVRSSSPEEDLENTSFAGMYETFLGVEKNCLEKAVSKAFASSFDYRVMSYKKQNRLSLEGTSIAVIVQRQIASDVSGVGFSLNPLNNAYDEVVINASFGLGEGIVSGIVTPDTYIVDSINNQIMEKKINEKKIRIKLNRDGGTEEVQNDNSRQQALSDRQIMELSKLIKKCESYYEYPIDIEWAYENSKLYLLQARPITTYLPLFPELLTKPEEKKKIYIDIMYMTQGFNDPMSVLGLQVWGEMLDRIKGGMMTPQVGGTTPAIHGRQYISITDIQKLMGKKGVTKFLDSYDGNIKRIFEDIGDLDHLVPDKKAEGTKGSKKKMAKTIITMIPSVFKSLFLDHTSVIEDYNRLANELVENAKNLKKEEDFDKNIEIALESLTTIMSSASAMMAGMISQQKIKKMFKDDNVENEIVALAMDLQGNPTSEMGHLLFKLASYEEFENIPSRKSFIEKAEDRSFSKEFLEDYDEFMGKFAARGFMEIDVASKRIYEDLGMLYDKLVQIDREDNQITKVKEKRKIAHDKLLGIAKEKGKEKKFLKNLEKYQETVGYREHPKYVIVLIFAEIHNICLELGKDWVNDSIKD